MHDVGERLAAAAARVRAGDPAGGADIYLSVLRQDVRTEAAWLGLAWALALGCQPDMVFSLVANRQAVAGDGFAFFHDILTFLLDHGHLGEIRLLHAEAPRATDLPLASMYAMACVHLLEQDEDAAFAALATLKPALAAARDRLPIEAHQRFNIAYRQATLAEDAPYLDGLDDRCLAAAAGLLPPIERIGDWREGGGRFILLAACDSFYFERFAAEFLRSLEDFPDPPTVHFHLVDPGPATLDLARVVSRNGRAVVNVSAEAANPHAGRAYYACARFLRAGEIMAAAGKPMVITDIDVAFQRPPAEVVDRAAASDHATFQRLDAIGPCSLLPAVLTWFDCGPGGHVAAAAVRRFVLSKIAVPPPFNWMLDQAALLGARRWLRWARPEVTVGSLGPSFAPYVASLGSEEEKATMCRAPTGA